MNQQELIALIRRLADELGLCGDLAVSIAMTESDCMWPKRSTRFEPAWKYFVTPEVFANLNGISVETERVEQATSWGPMHVMGSVCREFGFKGALPELFAPSVGVAYALKKLKALSERYENEAAVISSYNAGTPRKNPDGTYSNQVYVDRVTSRLRTLRSIG